ncbi:MAG: ABC transporter, permease protein 1 (cluster 1, maltose/g3p/polyamine/iron) [uncultured Chloroflexia bacterium]|uniref:ABC transporter, permease protein 1 (Cluster 1, maltose/g3p/polyamine/iron) n=1 Tax=uncultured Chloroflexia bacterium TaxID=1672391 RepID=A0A6J4J7T8_9CHLR|nr:MAG: ABC transporter, permease protein 1 (cluster 1, maltose/g3p/polyamine/iron) [uncultured Chloroflexia bacterium]
MATTVQQRDVAVPRARQTRRFSWVPYLFILPHLIFFLIFIAYPFFNGILISLMDYDYLRPERNRFVGIANYAKLFTPGTPQNATFWNALGNTVEFVIYSVPFLIVIPLLLAVLLNSKIPGRNIFRAIYFAPWALSVAVVALLWWWIFQSQGGLLNYYLAAIGIRAPRWLSSMPWAWVAIVVATVWWTIGFNMVILLAALQDIPTYIYEAASIDGATGIQAFARITLPLLRPVLLFIITTSIIASFNLMGQPFFMTNGGPGQASGGGATEPVMLRIYREGFERSLQGNAAAMSVVVAAIMIVISFANFKFFGNKD